MKVLFGELIAVLLVALALGSPQRPPGRDCYRNQNPDCFCSLYYAPVCGVNGCTYGNDCQLACANVKLAYPGECRRGRPPS
ncbi:hypothetical protein ABMA27_009269 [Loxostege sticticalis]|uniref:Kazal-like domain-containing protein n=1 Tax=Loxostege sticticalis TaxID=481309 RepID=A0ABR3HAY7_LOXSC